MVMRGMLRGLGSGKPASARAHAGAASGRGADLGQRRALLEAVEDEGLGWFWASNVRNELTYLSASAVQRFAPGAALFGEPLSRLFETVGEVREQPQRPLSFLLGARSRVVEHIVRLEMPEGPQWWSLTGRPAFDEWGDFIGYRGIARDISAEYARQCDSSRLAEYDSLTGLANRHRMGTRLTAILTAFRLARRSCALLLLDLDRFKHVNDTLGHPAGDDLLKQVAQRLGRIIPEQAEIGRLGGDEFKIIIPDMDDRGKLGELAHRIIQMVSQPYSIEGSRAIIGTSVGIAVAPYDGIEPDELVKAADLALYAAKGSGRAQYRFYSNDLKDSAQERRAIEEDLRDALPRGELQLHYQPVVRSKSHRLTGFEALMRWNHPERGPINPAQFIPVAEESNLICALGEWALRQACEDAAAWPGDLLVSVNVSAPQFSAAGFVASVGKALAASGLAPGRLELEITESVFLGDGNMAARTFARLKRLGVRLALDDFGTGYSSLGYLRDAPFDKIKIDQGFVRGSTEEGQSNAAIITAIVGLAEALRMETTAEGVEAMDELALVAARGATNVQGFVFSRAISQADVLAKIASGDLYYEPSGPERHRADRRSLYRTVGVIHEDYRYDAMLRNLSRTGARIDGLIDVPVGTELVLDLGEGQLVVAIVRRSQDATQGLEFETPLISDGADGLCTRHRISPYALASAGMPLRALPRGEYPFLQDLIEPRDPSQPGRPRFMQLDLSATSSRAT
ncbi:diguanylate phosphodiesterase [Altererythrobacter sp. B11]|uniref:putative bifunctional diguanylate cyclase/phosphodiesterase n=1 Tax=Altererythrobacter sp. B11 TaxID=2060312 RepID=UPI000DC702F7|nr:EAL domain-containing protein [Altererythrobacter sp. B11]BBC72451.1 diguanylate phosphodiesterase [Altererythrobacter sp. B11]